MRIRLGLLLVGLTLSVYLAAWWLGLTFGILPWPWPPGRILLLEVRFTGSAPLTASEATISEATWSASDGTLLLWPRPDPLPRLLAAVRADDGQMSLRTTGRLPGRLAPGAWVVTPWRGGRVWLWLGGNLRLSRPGDTVAARLAGGGISLTNLGWYRVVATEGDGEG